MGRDILGILRNLRGFSGKENFGGRVKVVVVDLEEEKRRKREKAVKMKSGSEVIGFLRRWV